MATELPGVEKSVAVAADDLVAQVLLVWLDLEEVVEFEFPQCSVVVTGTPGVV
jgi:hypothetical protein